MWARPAEIAINGTIAASARPASKIYGTKQFIYSVPLARNGTRPSGSSCPSSRPAPCRRSWMISATRSLQAPTQSSSWTKPAGVIMDQAGWHRANELVIPSNLTTVFLPPYSPELNSIERLWLYLKERFLSHRLWPVYDDIVNAVCNAWNRVLDEPGRIKSLCSLDWAKTVNN